MQDKIERTPDALATTIEGRTVLLNVGSGRCFETNRLGTFVWQLLEHPSTLPSIADQISQRFGVEVERAGADAAIFVQDLENQGLVQQVTP